MRVVRPIRLGALAWISTIQFFIAQFVVQSAWTTPFSLTGNYISDLGNTACGRFPAGSDMYVCSPWHAVMNASFILTGVTVVFGAVLLRDEIRPAGPWRWGLALIALGGLGFVLVGLFPENVNFTPHRLGAALQFVSGNFGQVVLAIPMLGSHVWQRWAVGSALHRCRGIARHCAVRDRALPGSGNRRNGTGGRLPVAALGDRDGNRPKSISVDKR